MTRKFVIKIIVFCGILSAVVYGIGHFFTRGFVDQYYTHFLKPSKSLIIGASRSLEGIMPQEVNKGMNKNYDLFNFAIDADIVKYGSVYFEAIKEKLVESDDPQLFILEINPLVFSRLKSNLSDDEKEFEEHKQLMAKQWFFNSTPNIEYLIKNHTPLFDLILNRNKEHEVFKPYPDGFLELTLPMDSLSYKKRCEIYMNTFNTFETFNTYSPTRMNYFKNIVEFLSKKGNIILVRMPVNKENLEREHRYLPSLDSIISNYANDKGIPYLNYVNQGNKYQSMDGFHLEKNAAKKFSYQLGHDIDSVLALKPKL